MVMELLLEKPGLKHAESPADTFFPPYDVQSLQKAGLPEL